MFNKIKHCISEKWIEDGYLGLRIPPETEGEIVRSGSCKDFGVKFKGFEKWTVEVNLEEIEFISPASH